MSEEKRKYAHLRLNELPDEKRYRGFAKWPGVVSFTDDDIIAGSYHLTAQWITSLPQPVHGPHSHNEDQLLVFLGSNPEDIHDLGCDVEICIGPEMERHVFSKTNLIYIPAGLVHGPLRFRNLRRPFILMNDISAPKLTETPYPELVSEEEAEKMVFFEFNGDQTEVEMDEQFALMRAALLDLKEETEPFAPMEPGETKYGKYVLTELSPEKQSYKFGRLAQTQVFVDNDVIPGCHHFWALMIQPGPWSEHGPHNHENPENMGTLGVDWNNPQLAGTEGGQDWMGEEMEHYGGGVSGQSGMTFMPAGHVHGPVRYGAIVRPFIMFQSHYAPTLTEKSYKHLVTDAADKESLVFFDLNGKEDEAALDKQRDARKKKPEEPET